MNEPATPVPPEAAPAPAANAVGWSPEISGMPNEDGMLSADGLNDDSAVTWVRSATFAWTLASRNESVVLFRTLTATAAPAPASAADGQGERDVLERLVVGGLDGRGRRTT